MALVESREPWFEDKTSLAILIGRHKSLSRAHPRPILQAEVLSAKATLYFKGQTSACVAATPLPNIKATKAGLQFDV